ncbi:MAG: hypothetical protein ACOC2E_01350 [Bacteroidota bacterium]
MHFEKEYYCFSFISFPASEHDTQTGSKSNGFRQEIFIIEAKKMLTYKHNSFELKMIIGTGKQKCITLSGML